MIYGVFKNGDDYFGGVYDTFDKFYADSFDPDTDIIGAFDFRLSGTTYTDKKHALETQAHIYNDTARLIDLSYGELYDLADYFEKNAKRYGLYRVFQENGIC